MKTITKTWQFEAQDSLFFRESRPMNSIGNAELSSVFPPSAQTLIGAIRHALGEISEVDWEQYGEEKQAHSLSKLIGFGSDYASLHFEGVWIHKKGQRLYPAPSNLMIGVLKETKEECKKREKKGQERKKECFFIGIDNALIKTDIGRIALPKVDEKYEGSKNLDNIWLTKDNYEQMLKGIPPTIDDWFILKSPSSKKQVNSLLIEESRVGIARDNTRRAVIKGRLYQTKHIRFTEEVSLCMDVTLDQAYEATSNQADNGFFVRLGGEGRLASITQHNPPPALECPDINQRFVMYLLSPLLIPKSSHQHWQPLPHFRKEKQGKQTVWKGILNGIELTLYSAVTGKAYREGGWDLAKHCPKPVKSYLPAGAAFYCSSEATPETIIKALHQQQIGAEQTSGRGKIALGKWV